MKGHLDLFVMSQCPYANRVLGVLGEVVDAFDRERSRMDLELVYIGQVKDGELTSMHGQAEVDEDKRQVCAQKYYRKNYKFLDYLACRSGNFEDDDWKSCAVDGIKASVISRCARGKEGKKLLKASFKKSETLGITGSPSWLLNNRHDMTGREPRDITSAFCERNAAVDGCAAITLEAEKKPDDTEDNAEADSPKPAPGAVYEGS
jgi:hypothetical protein